ncbi:MAG: Rieske (2Fe-2S) protein [Candidatus Kapaibacteriota bacterium]
METIELNNKQLIPVCNSNELFNKKGKLIKFDEDDDMQVAIFRIGEKLYCVSNICPHRHAEEIYNGLLTCEVNKLEKNVVPIENENNYNELSDVVTCPLHGWSYYLDSGFNTNPKQGIKRIKTYDIIEQNGIIYIEKPELDIPKWRQV